MTICVGVLAAGGKSIVCVADKAVSYGDSVMGETDSTKIVPLQSGAVAMLSGDETVFSRFLRKLGNNPKLGSSVADALAYCEKTYKEARAELISIDYLSTSLLTDKQFSDAVSAPIVNGYIKELAEKVAAAKYDCQILLCGFDGTQNPYIISVEDPGRSVEMSRLGYHAIGSGYEYAIARLLGSEWKRSKPTDECLYYALDAKISAEMTPYVGGPWDAAIIVPGAVHMVSEKTRNLLDEVWVEYDRSPYYQRTKENDDGWEQPPLSWKFQLRKYVYGITKEAPPNRKSPKGGL